MREKPLFFRYALGAWEMLSDLRLPVAVPGVSGAKSLPFFPLWGALCGALCVLIGALAALLTNRIAGAVVFAVAALALMLAKDSLRGVNALRSFAFARWNRGGFGEALKFVSCEGGEDQTETLVGAAFALIEFILLLLMGLYWSAWYLPFVLAGGFTVQGALAAEFGIAADPERTTVKMMWIVFVVVGVISFIFFPLATVIGAVAVYALAVPAVKFIRANVATPGADIVTLWGSLAELALLLSGFFWTIRIR